MKYFKAKTIKVFLLFSILFLCFNAFSKYIFNESEIGCMRSVKNYAQKIVYCGKLNDSYVFTILYKILGNSAYPIQMYLKENSILIINNQRYKLKVTKSLLILEEIKTSNEEK